MKNNVRSFAACARARSTGGIATRAAVKGAGLVGTRIVHLGAGRLKLDLQLAILRCPDG
jgi:hypothetical protein